MKVPAFFKNRYVLYITVVLGVVNLLGYIAMENYNSMALLVVMFLLSRYFSKNVAVNICIAILVTSFVTLNNKITEGMKESRNRSGTDASRRVDRSIAGRKSEDGVATAKLGERKIDQSERGIIFNKHIFSGENPGDPVKPHEPDREGEPEPKPINDREEPAPGECPEGTELVKGECMPMRRGFQNNVPSSKPSKISDDDDDMNVAAKMEDAYGNLNKMLGDGAMKSMAKETKKLVVQQRELMNTLSTMTPALNKAKETLENLNLPNMEEMTGILKKFTQ